MQTIHFHASSISGRVDRDAGIIRGAAVITGGITAKGHDLEVDEKTLDQIVACGNAKGRVQVKLNHRDPQALQSICGFIEGFRKEGNKVVADWHLLTTHDEFLKIIERAERMPECFGLSCAFAGPTNGEKKDGKKYARCSELISVDCVSAPAANPAGLFSRRSGERTMMLEGIAGKVIQLAQKLDREKKRELPVAVTAGLSGALSGAALGLVPAFRRGTKLKSVVKSVAAGGAGAAALVGGGTFIGGQILGKPADDEGAPYTKRAALGGALSGGAAGVVGGVLLRKTAAGRRALRGISKTWRPAVWARRSGTVGTAAIGGLAGAVIGGAHAADEGQQVDTIASLKKQRRRQTFSEFAADPRPRDTFGQFAPHGSGGVDPASMAAAYGGVAQEKQRRLAHIARVTAARRRVFGDRIPEVQPAAAASGTVSASVPRIERASEFIKRKLAALSPMIELRRKDDDEQSLRSRVAKGALIAGAGAAGISIGGRLGAKVAQRVHYRPARRGENVTGKIVAVKRNIGVAGFPVLPVLHTGVAAGAGRVIHTAPKQGLQDVSTAAFRRGSKAGGSGKLYVAREGSAAAPEAIRKAASETKDRPWRIGDNCEHGACRLTGGKVRSPQLRGALAGAAAGGLVASGATAATLRPEEERKRGVRAFAARIARNEIKL